MDADTIVAKVCFDSVARAALERGIAHNDLRDLRIQLVFDAAAAGVALLVATVLSIYKPAGTLAATGRHSLILMLLGVAEARRRVDSGDRDVEQRPSQSP